MTPHKKCIEGYKAKGLSMLRIYAKPGLHHKILVYAQALDSETRPKQIKERKP